MLIEKITGLGYAAAVQRDLLSGNGDGRIVVQDAQQPPTPLAAPSRTDGLVPDGHLLPNRAIASAGGAATGIAADAAALARWGYRLYGGQVLSPAATTALSTPVTDGYGLGTSIIGDGGQQALWGSSEPARRQPSCTTGTLSQAASHALIGGAFDRGIAPAPPPGR